MYGHGFVDSFYHHIPSKVVLETNSELVWHNSRMTVISAVVIPAGLLMQTVSGAGTNLRVIFSSCPSTFWAQQVQLVIFVSTLVMVSRVRSVSRLLFFYSQCQSICKSRKGAYKVGASANRANALVLKECVTGDTMFLKPNQQPKKHWYPT